MADTLIIVESPTKARTISRFLSRGYQVRASLGHVRDLPKSRFGIAIEDDFEPDYITIRGKGPLLKELKQEAKKAKRVLLATDPDREGEAISWHLAQVLGLDLTSKCRVEFHEITSKAIKEAFKTPRALDLDYVNAYQARRVLDRIFGYQLSPFLWRKLRYGLSAGRVQSVALRLICERDEEVASFVPQEYWSLRLSMNAGNAEMQGRLVTIDGAKPHLADRATVDSLLATLPTSLKVASVRHSERQRQPAAPYTTSTLQQDAAQRLGFPVRKTMQLAQQLYEGLELGSDGHSGLITYMRTDSTNISDEAFAASQEYLRKTLGDEYTIPAKRTFPGRKMAQEAHEAIRPTSITYTPEYVQGRLGRDLYRLYKLIWERFLASQCAQAVTDTIQADLPCKTKSGNLLFRINGSKLRFKGFLAVYASHSDADEEDENQFLPELTKGKVLQVKEWLPAQHFTQPPHLYSEPLLIKSMEELGIGRPSTYAATAETLLRRGYIVTEEKRFHPTDLGRAVNQLLVEHFQMVVETEFTAHIEDALDKVEAGEERWQQVVDFFYEPFSKMVDIAEKEVQAAVILDELVDDYCPECGKQLMLKRGRFGSFYACSGFPECRFTRSIVVDTEILCPKCSQGTLIERKIRRGDRFFYGCSAYPDCDYISWEKPVKRVCSACGNPGMSRRVQKRKQLARYRCLNPECLFEETTELDDDEDSASIPHVGESDEGGNL